MRALARQPDAPAATAPEPLARARGVVELGIERRDERTVVGRLYQQGCAKVRLLRGEPQHPTSHLWSAPASR